MSKNGQENQSSTNITKGGAIANHDTVNISADKKPLLSSTPTNSDNGNNTNDGSKKH